MRIFLSTSVYVYGMDLPDATPEALRAPKNMEWPASWTVRHVAETGSTNLDLVRYCSVGAATWPDKSILVTDHQTAGRGRLDRTWDATAGANLLASVLFREPKGHLHQLTQRIGLVIALAARELTVRSPLEQITLKWPNDVLYAGRKVAGVLAQACLDANNTLIGVVVGFGVNVRWCPEDAARLGDDVTPHELLHRILIEYDTLAALSDKAFHELYKANLSTLGSRVRVDLPTGESVTGTAVDVAPDGELKIVDACALTHLISAGDVVHLRVVN